MLTTDDTRLVRGLSDLDAVLYQSDDPLALEPAEAERVRFGLLRDAVAHQLSGCEAYAGYAARQGFSLDRLRSPADLDLVPLVPASIFKTRDLITEPTDGPARVCVSSGTQGGRSRVHRDRMTMERFLGSIAQGVKLVDAGPDDAVQIHVLGPDSDEAGELWFSYVLSIVDLLHPTTFLVHQDTFDVDAAIDALVDRPRGVRPVLIGPPVLVLDLALAAQRRLGSLDLGADDGLVVTAGGWKRFTGRALDRTELTATVQAALGLRGPQAVRDCFNMVELNTVLFECEQHTKHIPPWLRVRAVAPADLRVLPGGQEGVLGYLDALPNSYPGFVLSDDFGVVHENLPCRCGRVTDALRISRRIQTVEARGCALKMDGTVRR